MHLGLRWSITLKLLCCLKTLIKYNASYEALSISQVSNTLIRYLCCYGTYENYYLKKTMTIWNRIVSRLKCKIYYLQDLKKYIFIQYVFSCVGYRGRITNISWCWNAIHNIWTRFWALGFSALFCTCVYIKKFYIRYW